MINPIEKVRVVIDETFLIIDKDFKNIRLDSFSITLFQLIIKTMKIIEHIMKNEDGRVKKYVVIEIGKKMVEKYYPKKLEFYNDNIDNLIEMVIDSYYQFKKLKGSNNCLPCLP